MSSPAGCAERSSTRRAVSRVAPCSAVALKTKSISLKAASWTRMPHKCDPGQKSPRPKPLHSSPLPPAPQPPSSFQRRNSGHGRARHSWFTWSLTNVTPKSAPVANNTAGTSRLDSACSQTLYTRGGAAPLRALLRAPHHRWRVLYGHGRPAPSNPPARSGCSSGAALLRQSVRTARQAISFSSSRYVAVRYGRGTCAAQRAPAQVPGLVHAPLKGHPQLLQLFQLLLRPAQSRMRLCMLVVPVLDRNAALSASACARCRRRRSGLEAARIQREDFKSSVDALHVSKLRMSAIRGVTCLLAPAANNTPLMGADRCIAET